jgi:hypothetical protein
MPAADLVFPKDPVKVRAGQLGAQKRWADHAARTVRLDELTPEQRRLVLALVEAAKSGEKAVDDAA